MSWQHIRFLTLHPQFKPSKKLSDKILSNYETFSIRYYLYSLKNVKNTYGGVLLLVKLQAEAPPRVFFTFLKLCKWYRIVQSITYRNTNEESEHERVNQRRSTNCKNVRGVFRTQSHIFILRRKKLHLRCWIK